MDYQEWEQGLIQDSGTMGGNAVFPGSRVTVKRIASLVSGGELLTVIKEDYPMLSDTDIRFSVVFMKSIMFDESKYYLGKLCKFNHEYQDTGKSLRTKHRRGCVECNKLYNQKYHQDNKEKIKERKSKYWAENKTRLLLGRMKKNNS